MGWINCLFSFSGRINSAKYWKIIIVYVVIFTVPSIFFMIYETSQGPAQVASILTIGIVYIWLVAIFSLIVSFTLAVKRLHDRDKGSVWLIPFLVLPVVLNVAARLETSHSNIPHWFTVTCEWAGPILSIWAFIELGCLRGTVGPNRFGPDPLERLS